MIFIFSILFLLIFESNTSEPIYKGESFPVKYLQPEDVVPEYSDVECYLQGLNRMLGYVTRYANETCINRALGLFYMKAVLKRTIKENKNKIQEDHRKLMNIVISQAENIMSHFFYTVINPKTWDHILKRVAELLKNDDLQIPAIGDYVKNRLQKYILSDLKLNDFAQDMDEAKLPKEEYLKYSELSMESEEYILNIDESDYCLGEIIYNPMPQNQQTLEPCVAEEACSKIVYHRGPSIAYSLSHRMLNLIFPRHIRRCYMRSPKEDDELVDILCSSMYRETVYIARRGYFSRDMWMEHIALCALIGYEEFHRRHWFRKVMSWVDEQGCIAENMNYEMNRTSYMLAKEENPKKREKIMKAAKRIKTTTCHWHQMSLGLVVLAQGVRHAVHFSQIDAGKLKDEL